MGLRRAVGAAAAASAVGALALLGPAAAGRADAAVGAAERVQGDDRWGTAVAASRRLVPTPADDQVVLVASGDSFPDALSAAPATRGWGSPVPLLLVPRDGQLPPAVAGELDRLGTSEIYVIGGPAAVSDAVVEQLAHWDPAVLRVYGDDRYATAAEVALASTSDGATEPGTAYLASGANFPDALAGAAVAARSGSPLLLTDPRALPGATAEALDALDPASVVVLGGTGAVGDAVLDAVRAVLPGATVERRAGEDRYATAAGTARAGYPGGAPGVVLATGANFPDALAGGPLAAELGWPLLLVQRDCAPAPTRDAVAALGATQALVLGGPGVVTDAAASLAPCP